MKKVLIYVLGLNLVIGCSNDDNGDSFIDIDTTPSASNICENGIAAGLFPCDGFNLVSTIPLGVMGATQGNDSWGWTDPLDSKEYALIGLDNGTAFIDISTPETPKYIGKLNTATESSAWRDVKVYQNHAFIVSEARNHGMQVFDLTRLRNARSVGSLPVNFTADNRFAGFGSAHNIVINEDSGFAYAVGTDRSGPY